MNACHAGAEVAGWYGGDRMSPWHERILPHHTCEMPEADQAARQDQWTLVPNDIAALIEEVGERCEVDTRLPRLLLQFARFGIVHESMIAAALREHDADLLKQFVRNGVAHAEFS